MMISADVVAAALSDVQTRTRFIRWVATQCQQISQKRNRLALHTSLLLKSGGASHSTLNYLRNATGFVSLFVHQLHFRGLVGTATLCERSRQESASARTLILDSIATDDCPRLHWLDNYAKCFAANAIFIDKELFKSMLWTAHGMKRLSSAQDMSWVAKPSGVWISALPNLPDLLHSQLLDDLFSKLSSFDRFQFDYSFAHLRNVVRIPLKPSPVSDDEKTHLDSSTDGLRSFFPVDIYSDHVVSSAGLLAVLRRLQQLEGFSVHTHQRFGSYSLLHCDVAIFWQLFRLFYCESGMAPLRHDLIMSLGFWHPYMYGHVAIWNEFRHTFLAPAFFALFPNQKLLRRPKLSQAVLSSHGYGWHMSNFNRCSPVLCLRFRNS
jgi:hypothetical protein